MKFLCTLILSIVSQFCFADNLPILMFHKLVPDNQNSEQEAVRFGRFEEHLKMLKAGGYKTFTISEITILIRSHSHIPPKAVLITFDDGWHSNLDAVKLLEKYNQKATFYILSGAFEDPQYLSKEDVKLLSKKPNVEIGAHTHTHFMKYVKSLDKLDTQIIIGEMAESKLILEHTINKPVVAFAWPFGYVRQEAENMAEELGFTSIVQTKNSINVVNDSLSPMKLQRLNIDGKCTSVQVKKMIDSGVFDQCDN